MVMLIELLVAVIKLLITFTKWGVLDEVLSSLEELIDSSSEEEEAA